MTMCGKASAKDAPAFPHILEIDTADFHIAPAPAATASTTQSKLKGVSPSSPALHSLQAHLSIGKDCDREKIWQSGPRLGHGSRHEQRRQCGISQTGRAARYPGDP